AGGHGAHAPVPQAALAGRGVPLCLRRVTVYAEHRHGAHAARWLATIDEAYDEMERRIDAATSSVRLESYLLREEGPATRLSAALLRARARGVEVSMLLDAFGTEEVDPGFFEPLLQQGVRITLFNPQRWLRR